ncbi:MAG: putative DExH-box ATP-dependent RNA helicase DExH11, partial [Streblomastix strix]
MLQDSTNALFLSATVPNALEFTEWVGNTKHRKVAVVRTDFRPVPLEHYLYPGLGDQIYMVMDRNKIFYSNAHKRTIDVKELKLDESSMKSIERSAGGIQQAIQGIQGGKDQQIKKKYNQITGRDMGFNPNQGKGGFGGNSYNGRIKSEWNTLLNMLRQKDLLPAIVFVFSKKGCDECARAVQQQLDLIDSKKDREIIQHRYQTFVINALSPEDQLIPQIQFVQQMLLRGVSVHHAGLLPIVKECVEILFAEGLIKVLFATETLAVGVNLPARTVIFRGLRKYTGQGFRMLLPGEYTQMSGRAGRRGIDNIGTVIVNLAKGDAPSLLEIQHVLNGVSLRLESKFHLTSSLVLNVVRGGGNSVNINQNAIIGSEEKNILSGEYRDAEQMIQNSFSEFHSNTARPVLKVRYEKIIGKLFQLYRLAKYDCQQIRKRNKNKQKENKQPSSNKQSQQTLSTSTFWPQGENPFQLGRVVLLSTEELPFAIGMIVRSNIRSVRQFAADGKKAQQKIEQIDQQTNESNQSESSIQQSPQSNLIPGSAESQMAQLGFVMIPKKKGDDENERKKGGKGKKKEKTNVQVGQQQNQNQNNNSGVQKIPLQFGPGINNEQQNQQKSQIKSQIQSNIELDEDWFLNADDQRIAILALLPPLDSPFSPFGSGGGINNSKSKQKKIKTKQQQGNEQSECINGISFSDTRKWSPILLFVRPYHITFYTRMIISPQLVMKMVDKMLKLEEKEQQKQIQKEKEKDYDSPEAKAVIITLMDYLNSHQPFCNEQALPLLSRDIFSHPEQYLLKKSIDLKESNS